MKLSVTSPILSLIRIHLASAKALLAVFPSSVIEGKSYPVEWLSDSKDYLELRLVRQNDHGWSSVQTLFENRTGNAPGDTYQWTVDTNLTAGSGYGLWLQSISTNPDVTLGYADLTEWFDIRFANGSVPTTTSVSSLAATTSVIGSTFTLSRSSTVTATTKVTATAQSASTDDGATRSNGLSKSAVVGIAVSVAVGGIVLLVAGVIAIVRYRRRHTQTSIHSQRPPSTSIHEMARPSFVTTGTMVELPEDFKAGRVEIAGQSRYPLEKDASDTAYEKKTVLPDKPVEIG